MRRTSRISSFLLIVMVLALAVAGSLPHHHATAEDAHHCTMCVAHRTPALPVGDLPVGVDVLWLVSSTLLLQHVEHTSFERSTQSTRAPPASA